MSEVEADTCTSGEQAGTHMSEVGVDRCASLEEAGRRIPAGVADSRPQAAAESSKSQARGTCALLVVSARNSRTSLTRLKSKLRKMDKPYVRPYIVRGKRPP